MEADNARPMSHLRTVSAGCGLVAEQLRIQWLTGDLVGPVGASVQALEGGVDVGQILCDGVQVEGALFDVHCAIVEVHPDTGRCPL